MDFPWHSRDVYNQGNFHISKPEIIKMKYNSYVIIYDYVFIIVRAP